MQVPQIALGNLQVSRLILGGNPFAGFSHQSLARDAEMRAWYTDERIIETFFQAEALGLNAVICRGDAHMAACLRRYWQQGGTLKWIAQTASEAETPRAGAEFCLDQGASACYIHGGVVDYCVAQGRFAELEAAARAIRAAGAPAGIAGHVPEDFRWAETGLDVDFYMVSYYNPTPRQANPHNVRGLEESFLVEDRDARVALIQELKRPAIHYKIMAAGRTPPAEALAFAARHMRPTDAVCIGVFTKDNPDMLREDLELLIGMLTRRNS